MTRGLQRARSSVIVALTLLLAGTTAWSRGITAVQGLDSRVFVSLSDNNVPTIMAKSETDVVFVQGYLHARDRLFQMDSQRRLFSGTLAELLGPGALAQDVQLRTLGLRRAAEASFGVQTPEVKKWLQAYSDGVNAFLKDERNELPREYAALEITKAGVPPWTPLDTLTVVKGIAFGLSFDLDDIDRTIAFLAFNATGNALGFNGLALFYTDLYGAASFDTTVSIPQQASAQSTGEGPVNPEQLPQFSNPEQLLNMLQAYKDKAMESPVLRKAFDVDYSDRGSNWWVVAGENTDTGYPLLANDPHLALDSPATFYEAHLSVRNGINVAGISFPGAPGIVQGCNNAICWGSTVNPLDVTDVYQEVLVAVPTEGLPPGTFTHTFFEGGIKPLLLIPQTYLFNAIGDGVPNTLLDAGLGPTQGGLTLVVPHHNFAPIVQVDASNPEQVVAFSVAYTGWAPTQELEAFRQIARADSVGDFKKALQFFDVGSQNWAYADIHGDIAYFTSAEIPLREDFQILGFPDGFQPPLLIRDGTHTLLHEWLPLQNPQPGQALPFEILPFEEMPQWVNPDQGYILNANNDPVGTTADNLSFNQFRDGGGVYYLSPGYAQGFRQGRIQRVFDGLLADGGKVSLQESIDAQANNQLLDAEVFIPHLLGASFNFSGSTVVAGILADARVQEALARLQAWDFSTPTGIREGYDPGDDFNDLQEPTQDEINASVAATIYSAWRGQLVQRIVDGTLTPLGLQGFAPGSGLSVRAVRRVLDNFPNTGGLGGSGINFLTAPGVDGGPLGARDSILLGTLQSALDLLASDTFAAAFENSTDQNDYRWGKLHRIVFDSLLGSPFSVPPSGELRSLSAELPGVARAGGFGAVDASSHSARADGVNEFMFGSGPNRRVQAIMTPSGPKVLQVIPGGQSGEQGSRFQTDQLKLWLVNDYHTLPLNRLEVLTQASDFEFFIPKRGRGVAVVQNP